MSEEWKRLTPEGARPEAGTLFYQCYPDSDLCHRLKVGPYCCADVSNPEALAFVIETGLWRKVPQVKAIVRAAGEIRDALENNAAPMKASFAIEKVGEATLCASLLLNLLNTLIPFEGMESPAPETEGES